VKQKTAKPLNLSPGETVKRGTMVHGTQVGQTGSGPESHKKKYVGQRPLTRLARGGGASAFPACRAGGTPLDFTRGKVRKNDNPKRRRKVSPGVRQPEEKTGGGGGDGEKGGAQKEGKRLPHSESLKGGEGEREGKKQLKQRVGRGWKTKGAGKPPRRPVGLADGRFSCGWEKGEGGRKR